MTTSIQFKNGFVGFAWEQIENHSWTSKSLQYRVGTNNYENMLINEHRTKKGWPDTKNFWWFFSPDGDVNHRIAVESLSEAIRLRTLEWVARMPEDPPEGGYVIVTGSLDSGIGEVIGPFIDMPTSLAYAERVTTDTEDYSTHRLTIPDATVMET